MRNLIVRPMDEAGITEHLAEMEYAEGMAAIAEDQHNTRTWRESCEATYRQEVGCAPRDRQDLRSILLEEMPRVREEHRRRMEVLMEQLFGDEEETFVDWSRQQQEGMLV